MQKPHGSLKPTCKFNWWLSFAKNCANVQPLVNLKGSFPLPFLQCTRGRSHSDYVFNLCHLAIVTNSNWNRILPNKTLAKQFHFCFLKVKRLCRIMLTLSQHVGHLNHSKLWGLVRIKGKQPATESCNSTFSHNDARKGQKKFICSQD